MLKLFFVISLILYSIYLFYLSIKELKIHSRKISASTYSSYGIIWLFSGFFELAGAITLFNGTVFWWILCFTGVILSEFTVIISKKHIKLCSAINLLLLPLIIVGFGSFLITAEYSDTVKENLKSNNNIAEEMLTENDISVLPIPVQKYLRYTKSVGKPKIKNFRAEFTGGIRFNPDEDYMELKSTQYNFFDKPARLFHIVAYKMGVPAAGLHLYENEQATFRIKLLNWFPVVDAKGEKMDQGETVTVFNDMCFMAPASLIDKRIKWESIDEKSVKAVFTNGNISISAILYFNDKGELINFVSDDRFETDGKVYNNYRWYTPVMEYRDINGYRLPSKAKLTYLRPSGEFTYGEFVLKDIVYNTKEYYF